MNLVTLTLLATALFSATSNGHRILGIFAHIGASHYHTFYPIMSALAERGHDVTVLSYFTAKHPPPNYHEIRLDGLDVIDSSLPLNEVTSTMSYYDRFDEFFSLFYLGDIVCRDIYHSRQLDEVLRLHDVQPFDLVVTELFDTDCMLGVIHMMNVPYVGLSSCVLMPWLYDRVALPDLPSFVPSEFIGYSERMTFAQRFKSWLVTKSMKIMYKLIQRNDDAYIRAKFGDGIPSVSDLAQRVSLVLVNVHFSFHMPRPLPPQVVEIGGVHIKPAKPIPQDLLDILEKAKNGVILISWGSNVKMSTLPEDKVFEIVNALKRLPLQVILKWENATLPHHHPANIHIRSWLPQRDLLCHPKVRLFWSHGGNLGTSESVHCGIPMVVTPIYGDQFVNMAALVHRGMAVELQIDDIEAEKVHKVIKEALKPEYKENAEATSFAFRDRPLSPVDTAVWWINHVIATKGFPLGRSYAVEMSGFAYHSIDVILVLIGMLSIAVSLVYLLTRWCCRSKGQLLVVGRAVYKKKE